MFEKSVRSVAHRLGTGTGSAQFSVVFNKVRKSRPVIVTVNLVKHLRLTVMSCKGMIVRVLKNTES